MTSQPQARSAERLSAAIVLLGVLAAAALAVSLMIGDRPTAELAVAALVSIAIAGAVAKSRGAI